MKVLANSCFGGFGLSTEAHEWLIKNKGWKVTEYGADNRPIDKDAELVKDPHPMSRFSKYHETDKVEKWSGDNWYAIRTNPDVIECVEVLGSKIASSGLAEIRVAEVPDGVEWEIDDYDGIETIREKHRSW